jgi:hypothetical protein
MLPSVVGGPGGCLGFMLRSWSLTPFKIALDRLAHKIGFAFAPFQNLLDTLERPSADR